MAQFLTDSEGRTLYLFTKDTEPGVSTCGGECLVNWPAYTPAEPLTLPDGVEGTLTLVDTPDGVQTLAYNDIPLYYFIGDTEPGQTNGQGVGDVWYVVAPGEQFGAHAMGDMASPMASPMAMAATTTSWSRPTRSSVSSSPIRKDARSISSPMTRKWVSAPVVASAWSIGRPTPPPSR